MLKKDVLKYFKNHAELLDVLGLSSTGSISQWGDVIPEKQALRLEKLTKGKLRYKSEMYAKSV